MIVELISVGTEILLGDIINTNAAYISKLMAACGANVLHQSTVGDNRKRLTEVIRLALSRSDIIILTGGLGPTDDDITTEVTAEVFNLRQSLDESLAEKIREYFKKRGRFMPESNLKQAMKPEGAIVIENNNGTAPGFIMEKGEKAAIILPGPPSEMKPMIDRVAEEYIAPKTGRVIVSHNIRTFGIGESDMAQRVKDLLDGENPTVAPYAKTGEALLRITASGDTKEECEAEIRPVIDEIESRIGEYIYGIDKENIEEATVELLKKKGLTVACAESLTGGLIAKRITDISGASEIFECGVVSYSNRIKNAVLGVKEKTLENFKAVSAETAAEMADGIRKLSGADIGVSATGIAGPGSDGSGKEAGLIYIGISSLRGTRTVRLTTGHSGESCREYNRTVAASNALDEVRKEAKKLK